jgi:hypothetical protein
MINEWDRIMDQARSEARINRERRKVVAVRVSARTERIIGSRWAYVIQCGTRCRVCEARWQGAYERGTRG